MIATWNRVLCMQVAESYDSELILDAPSGINMLLKKEKKIESISVLYFRGSQKMHWIFSSFFSCPSLCTYVHKWPSINTNWSFSFFCTVSTISNRKRIVYAIHTEREWNRRIGSVKLLRGLFSNFNWDAVLSSALEYRQYKLKYCANIYWHNMRSPIRSKTNILINPDEASMLRNKRQHLLASRVGTCCFPVAFHVDLPCHSTLYFRIVKGLPINSSVFIFEQTRTFVRFGKKWLSDLMNSWHRQPRITPLPCEHSQSIIDDLPNKCLSLRHFNLVDIFLRFFVRSRSIEFRTFESTYLLNKLWLCLFWIVCSSVLFGPRWIWFWFLQELPTPLDERALRERNIHIFDDVNGIMCQSISICCIPFYPIRHFIDWVLLLWLHLVRQMMPLCKNHFIGPCFHFLTFISHSILDMTTIGAGGSAVVIEAELPLLVDDDQLSK